MRKFLIAVIIVVIAGAVVYFGFYNKNSDQVANTDQPSDEVLSDQELPPVEPDPVFAEPVIYTALKNSYSGAGFTFKYPDGFKVTSAPVSGTSPESTEGASPELAEGTMVTIENEKGSGFQIYIISFDESGMITPERIQEDLPDAVINDPKNAELDGVKTLVFNGYDENFGDTFEAWANNKGKLYQISGPKTAEQLIIETLETWNWQ